MIVIVDETSRGGQGTHLTKIVEVERGQKGFGNKLRVRIERDSYDTQSWARVDAWRQAGWVEVYSLPKGHDAIRALPSYAIKTGETEIAMRKLADELITIAREVVGG